jgi:hypothetical protein
MLVSVMPGLVPGIHVLNHAFNNARKDLDGPDKQVMTAESERGD